MEMNNITGIKQYDTPLKVDFIEWVQNHMDCDCIVKDNNEADKLYIIAYAVSKEYNPVLFRLREHIPDSRYMRGLPSSEVNSIG